jgi:hypothetical protein
MLLSRDPKLKVTAPKAIPVALSRGDLMGAFRLLLIHQYLADDSQTAVNDALEENPGLWALDTYEYIEALQEEIAESGHLNLF